MSDDPNKPTPNEQTRNDQSRSDNEQTRANDEAPLTFWQIAGSTVAAAFGVQKRANRERDFARGKPLHFIVAGIVFTVVFVLIVVTVVQLVLRSAS